MRRAGSLQTRDSVVATACAAAAETVPKLAGMAKRRRRRRLQPSDAARLRGAAAAARSWHAGAPRELQVRWGTGPQCRSPVRPRSSHPRLRDCANGSTGFQCFALHALPVAPVAWLLVHTCLQRTCCARIAAAALRRHKRSTEAPLRLDRAGGTIGAAVRSASVPHRSLSVSPSVPTHCAY